MVCIYVFFSESFREEFVIKKTPQMYFVCCRTPSHSGKNNKINSNACGRISIRKSNHPTNAYGPKDARRWKMVREELHVPRFLLQPENVYPQPEGTKIHTFTEIRTTYYNVTCTETHFCVDLCVVQNKIKQLTKNQLFVNYNMIYKTNC